MVFQERNYNPNNSFYWILYLVHYSEFFIFINKGIEVCLALVSRFLTILSVGFWI